LLLTRTAAAGSPQVLAEATLEIHAHTSSRFTLEE
jgi:hypothetical protein